MWALLNRLALALSGDTPGGVTAEQCYLDLLAEFGVEREIFEMPLRALPQFKCAYRVTHIIEHLPGGRCRVAAAPGTSCYTTQQMHDFIERIFDRLSEAGVDDAETTEQYRDWRRADG